MIGAKHILVGLVLTLFVACCYGQNGAREKTFRFYENSRLEQRFRDDVLKNFNIVEGDQLVFEFGDNNGGEAGNYSVVLSKLVFQIDAGKRTFHLKDEEITQQMGAYKQYRRTQDWGAQPIARGFIKGQRKADNTWTIELDVTFEGCRTAMEYHIQESAVFTLAEKE